MKKEPDNTYARAGPVYLLQGREGHKARSEDQGNTRGISSVLRLTFPSILYKIVIDNTRCDTSMHAFTCCGREMDITICMIPREASSRTREAFREFPYNDWSSEGSNRKHCPESHAVLLVS